ncbi:MAG: Exodeoxyribonuclease [Promethearchaeota archaeon]|nr:MAG: Exodeoxyribonuclease [Candidatus Lokiarchaeota archaeon]
MDFVLEQDADIYLFQETKTTRDDIANEKVQLEEYESYWCSSKDKKGYSGIVTFCKTEPLSIQKGLGIEKLDKEGRLMALEFDSCFVINVYFPNAGRNLDRLDFKMYFNREFLHFCEKLNEEKPLIIGGDFNVAHKEKDLANPDSNQQNAGFTIEEREWFSKFLENGYIDTFREFDQEEGKYTYWTYRYNAREKNIGWRIDYFVVNKEIKQKVKDSYRLADIKGSDHCPIVLEVENHI